MVFWIGILVGGVFLWRAVKIGFLETWTASFNIVISIYIAVFSTQAIIDGISAANETSFGYCFTTAAVAIGVFLILSGISYTFLTGRFKISFPLIFDTVGSGVLGFAAGMLAWSFLVLLLSLTPLARSDIARSVGIGGASERTHVQYVSWWCDWIGAVASRKGHGSTEKIIAEIADIVERKQERIEQQKEPEPPRRLSDDLGFSTNHDIGHAPPSQGPPPQGPPES